MIQLQGQLCCSFSLGEIDDFIDITDLNSFTLFEQAGNVRPILKLSFKTYNEEVVKRLNSGNILNVGFGIDEPTKDVIEFEIYEMNVTKEFGELYNVTLSAALYVPGFTSTQLCVNYGNKTSVEVLNEIANTYGFKLITNISKTNDKMNWYQSGCTPWEYIRSVWLHSYINADTFQTFALDSLYFYFYDMRQLVLQNPKWIFSNKLVGPENYNVVNIGSYFTQDISGVTSDLVGKNLNIRAFNTDTTKVTVPSYSLKNLSTTGPTVLNLNSNRCTNYSYHVTNNDQHGNYISAYNQNLRNNILYSSFITYVVTAGQFKKFNLLDTVAIDIDPHDERMEGTSYITGIAYQYQNNSLTMNITLNKECASGIVGRKLQAGG